VQQEVVVEMNSFVYKWVHKPSLNWYIGLHTGTVDDGYICSSPIKSLILNNSDDWERTIIEFGNRKEMFDLETEILQLFNAKNDNRSFNKHNNTLAEPGWNAGIPMKDETKELQREQRLGKSTAKKGRTYPNSHSIEARKKKSELMMGDTRNKGKPWSEARRNAQITKQTAK